MSGQPKCKFTGHEESRWESVWHTVYAESFETAAEAIAALQDGADKPIPSERRIVVWPWGLQRVARVYVVAAKLVYSTKCRVDEAENHPLKPEGSTSSGE